MRTIEITCDVNLFAAIRFARGKTGENRAHELGELPNDKSPLPRVQGNDDEDAETQLQAKVAEVARITPTWQGPVAENNRELPAGDDGDRRLPGH